MVTAPKVAATLSKRPLNEPDIAITGRVKQLFGGSSPVSAVFVTMNVLGSTPI
jgi:hypothetical protein